MRRRYARFGGDWELLAVFAMSAATTAALVGFALAVVYLLEMAAS